jgi:hypothetical protein
MMLELINSGLIFILTSFGLGWPLASRLPLAPTEKLVASLILSLITLWLAGWLIYTWVLPWNLLWLLPPLAAAELIWRRAPLLDLLRDPVVRVCLIGQLLVSCWCVGWLALVQNYSGGGWTSDWFEHWERATFFLNRGSSDHLFLGIYPLTARPPLGNVIMAAWLQLTQVDFSHYQLFSTLFASLVYLPAAALALRWRKSRDTVAVLTLLFLVSPLLVQNAVFPWTKLPAAFFTLGALYFYLRFRDERAPRVTAVLFSLALAAGLLTHFSAAPYAVALALAWCLGQPAAWRKPEFLRTTAIAAGSGLLLLATWFGWAFATYGVSGTLATNTSVTTVAGDAPAQLGRMALNLRDTLVPHFLRSPDPSLIAQTSPWGYARDWFFQSYQLNLFLAFGSVAWFVMLRELWRQQGQAAPADRRFWWSFGLIVIVLGIVTHGARDEWGLAQICLQALVVLGLAFLAAHWTGLTAPWRRLLVAGATFDFLTGIALHFAVQNHALDRWFTPERNATEIIASYNFQTKQNLIGLIINRFETFSGTLNPPDALVPALLAAMLILALWRCREAARS